MDPTLPLILPHAHNSTLTLTFTVTLTPPLILPLTLTCHLSPTKGQIDQVSEGIALHLADEVAKEPITGLMFKPLKVEEDEQHIT